MKLQRRLVEARKKAGLSQADLAKKLGVSRGTVAGWEISGEHSHGMRVERLAQVAKVLGVDLAELLA